MKGSGSLFSKEERETTAASLKPSFDCTGYPGPPEVDPPTSFPRLELVHEFRSTNEPDLPKIIPVNIQSGQSFIIGRAEKSIMTPAPAECNFRFAWEHKAISRRQAAIERRGDDYFVVDLASTNGTFVYGERLTPNVPQLISSGTQISFSRLDNTYRWVLTEEENWFPEEKINDQETEQPPLRRRLASAVRSIWRAISGWIASSFESG